MVDSSVLLDIFTQDPTWFSWSAHAISTAATATSLVINPLIYAEVSARFLHVEELEEALPPIIYRREALPWDAAFLAGKAHLAYRRAGGTRRSPLPDFYIGAHAAVRAYAVLTRDAARYRTYFPSLAVIAPDSPVR